MTTYDHRRCSTVLHCGAHAFKAARTHAHPGHEIRSIAHHQPPAAAVAFHAPALPDPKPPSLTLTLTLGGRLPLLSLSTLLPWRLPPAPPRRWSSGRLPPGLVDTTRPYLRSMKFIILIQNKIPSGNPGKPQEIQANRAGGHHAPVPAQHDKHDRKSAPARACALGRTRSDEAWARRIVTAR